jgi:acyl-CoA synthetase (NDP forming)
VPLAAVFMTGDGPPTELHSGEVRVPGYEFPEEAARAVALAARYGRWRSAPQAHTTARSDVHPERAAAIISRELGSGSGWLSPDSVAALLACYRLPLIETRIVPDAEQAIAAAAQIGMPVAVKASARGLVHKSDGGGVQLNLNTPDAVRSAAAQIEASLAAGGHPLEGLIVQPMAPAGVELIVGVVHDHSFGPVLACGAGGTTAELLKDVAVRITPLTAADAGAMLRSLRTFPLLDGYRGASRCDLEAIEDVLLRVSAMVEAHPEIVELDCNPVIVLPDRAVIVDARVRIEPAAPTPPLPWLAA